MHCPLALLGPAFAAGIFAESTYPFSSSALIPFVLTLGLLLPFLAGSRLFFAALVLQLFFLGGLHYRHAARRPPHAVENQAPRACASLEGLVANLPAAKFRGKSCRVHLVLEAERLLTLKGDCPFPENGRPVFSSALLDLMNIMPVEGQVQIFLLNPKQIPQTGERIRVFGSLERPRAVRQPGETDFRRVLAQRRIYASFSASGSAALQVIEPAAEKNWLARLQHLRQTLGERIEKAYPMAEDGALPVPQILKALVLGLGSQIPGDLWMRMIQTGTAHLISVSGLHMTVFSAAFFLCVIAAGASQKHAASAALAASLFYMGLAGAGIPIQRATLSGAAAYAAVLCGREEHRHNLFFLAFLLVLLHDPLALNSIAFQLSFLSVFSLLCLPGPQRAFWIEPLRISAAILAGTLPAAAWHFHLVSWSGMLANLWAIPCFHGALLGGLLLAALGGLPLMTEILAFFCAVCLKAAFWGIDGLARFAAGYAVVARPSWLQVVLYYSLAGAWLYTPPFLKKGRRRFVLLAIWLLAAASFFLPVRTRFHLTLFAGGREPLLHVQQGRRDWLVNPGTLYPSDLTHKVLLPYFRARGLRRLDGVILTRYDRGKLNALGRLMQELTVAAVYGPLPKLRAQTTLPFGGPRQPPWKRLQFHRGIEEESELSLRDFSHLPGVRALEIRRHHFVFLLVEAGGQQLISRLQHYYRLRHGLYVCLVLYGRPVPQPLIRQWSGMLKPDLLILPVRQNLPPLKQREAARIFFLNETGALQFEESSDGKVLQLHAFTAKEVSLIKPGLLRSAAGQVN